VRCQSKTFGLPCRRRAVYWIDTDLDWGIKPHAVCLGCSEAWMSYGDMRPRLRSLFGDAPDLPLRRHR
jgi:hypothetical protein